MTAWSAVRDHFLAGPPPRVATFAPPAPPPVAVAVICAPEHAAGLGGAVALSLARGREALVSVWTGAAEAPAARRVPATPRAGRLAAALSARGIAAHASGRLAFAVLPADESGAAAAWSRAAAVAGSAPAVLVVAGPRGEAFGRVLAEQDLILVAPAPGAEPALADLAVARLAGRHPHVRRCAVPPPAARLAAAVGLALLPAARVVLGPSPAQAPETAR